MSDFYYFKTLECYYRKKGFLLFINKSIDVFLISFFITNELLILFVSELAEILLRNCIL